ncbi:hypothetical protein RJD24_15390 [Bacillaceae bacterium IKA-2]|nr:hypothetical protein RJD24_15390 [Bacillaceae bacterium IKA-2]
MLNLKSIVLMVTVILQVVALIFFFIDIVTAIYLFAFHILGWVFVLVLIIIERIKEKKEEDDDDFSNY